ncbi:hypothetical protein [Streptomyces sp. NPDC002851]
MSNDGPKVHSVTPEAEGDGEHHDGSGIRWWGGPDAEEHQKQVEGNHDSLLSSNTNAQGDRRPDRVADHRQGEAAPTNFFDYSINGMKEMVNSAQPDQIDEVRLNWMQVFEWLSGGDSQSDARTDVEAKDSVLGMLKAAVTNVTEHWEGQAAAAFTRKANEIAISIQNASRFAKLTAQQIELANNDLKEVRTKIADIEEPNKVSSFGDWVSDGGEQNDEQAMKDLKNGVRADVVAAANEGELSAGMERKLQAVALMEQLAANYTTYARNLRRNSSTPIDDDKKGIGKPNEDLEHGGPIGIPGAGIGGPGKAGGAAKPWSAGLPKKIDAAPTTPRDRGITGGSQLPGAKTNIDSISPGLTGKNTLPNSGGLPGPGGSGPGGTGGTGLVPGGGPGLAGAGRGGTGPGGRPGIGGMGGAGANRGTGGRAAGGRPGMGGMGGMGAGAGRGGASAGGRGALAKARGGVVGAAKGIGGKGNGGGAGLHGSRGGTQRGAMAGGMGAGMAGRGNGRGDDKDRGDRPDYLVEDEETWISEEDRNRNVPRNIE